MHTRCQGGVCLLNRCMHRAKKGGVLCETERPLNSWPFRDVCRKRAVLQKNLRLHSCHLWRAGTFFAQAPPAPARCRKSVSMLTRRRQRGNSSIPSCGWASELGISVMLPVHAITEFHPFLSPPLSVRCTGFNVHVVCHAVRRSCHVLQFQALSLLAHHAAP